MDLTAGTMVAAVLAGAASFLSPCVLPLLPGYVGLMTGYSMQQFEEGTASTGRVLAATALFVAGFTAVFVLLFGAAASTIGQALRSPTLTTISGWLIVVLGVYVAVTAVWTPSFLAPLMRERRIDPAAAGRFGVFAAPLMGAAFSFGWTPCIGPFLASALVLGTASDTMGRGMLVMLFYSLGLGIPFIVTSLLLATGSSLSWVRRHMRPITVVSGLLLAGFGALMVTGNVGLLSAWISRLMIRLGLEQWTVV